MSWAHIIGIVAAVFVVWLSRKYPERWSVPPGGAVMLSFALGAEAGDHYKDQIMTDSEVAVILVGMFTAAFLACRFFRYSK